MATLRSLNINIRAGTATLQSDFSKASSLVAKFQQDAKRSFSGITGSILNVKTALAGLVGTAGFTALIKSSYDSIDALAKQADKLGISTQAMAGLQHASALAGIDNEKLNVSLVTMEKNIGDLYNGTGRAADAFKNLGITADQLKGLQTDQQFALIADKLSQVRDATVRANDAYKIFGESGVDILNITRDGAKGLADATQEAQRLGIAVSRFDAAKIEAANDAFTRAGEAIKGVANGAAVQLAPILEAAANQFTALIERNNAFRDQIIPTLESATKAVGFMADTVRGLEAVFTGVEVIALGFGSAVLTAYDEINKGIASITNIIINTVKGPLLAALDALGTFSDTAKAAADAIRNFQGVQPNTTISDWAESSRQSLVKAEAELGRLVNTPMPSKNIDAWFAKVKADAENAAKVIASSSAKLQSDAFIGPTINPNLLKQRQDLQKQLDGVTASVRTQAEVIEDTYNSQVNIVLDSVQKLNLSVADSQTLMTKVANKYSSDMAGIKSNGVDSFRALQTAVKGWGNQFTDTLANMALHGKLNFKRLADSIISDLTRIAIYEAITKPALLSLGIPAFAKGGVMGADGPMPLEHYASGGIANRATIFIAGEAGPEAIVPLPDGRSIPVEFSGSGSGGQQVFAPVFNFSISAVDARGVDALLMARKDTIAAAVQKVYNRNARLGGPYR